MKKADVHDNDVRQLFLDKAGVDCISAPVSVYIIHPFSFWL